MKLFDSKSKQALKDPLMQDNPITFQVLGICSALAVTVKMDTAIVMSFAVIAVLSISNTVISILRKMGYGNMINISEGFNEILKCDLNENCYNSEHNVICDNT